MSLLSSNPIMRHYLSFLENYIILHVCLHMMWQVDQNTPEPDFKMCTHLLMWGIFFRTKIQWENRLQPAHLVAAADVGVAQIHFGTIKLLVVCNKLPKCLEELLYVVSVIIHHVSSCLDRKAEQHHLLVFSVRNLLWILNESPTSLACDPLQLSNALLWLN